MIENIQPLAHDHLPMQIINSLAIKQNKIAANQKPKPAGTSTFTGKRTSPTITEGTNFSDICSNNLCGVTAKVVTEQDASTRR
uniref:Uncharacterized protein n=1 Tax=Rhizophora mucronata TaxID=61149 RepID=A0A2P2Q5A8_RHIMU